MKGLKIVIDARFYGLEHAGLGRYTTELVKNLSRLGNGNSYYVLLRKKYYDSLNFPSNWQKVPADYKHYSFAEQIKLPKLIKSLNPDITHYLHFNVPLFAPKPFIVTIHDMIMHESRGVDTTTLPPYQYLLRRIGYKVVFANSVYRASKIISPSIFVKNQIANYFKTSPQKIYVTPLGIDKSFFKGIKEKKTADYFLYVGSAYPHKNLVRLIKAVKKINSNLVIVTSRNIFTQRLTKTIKKLKAQKNVRLMGFVEDKKLKQLYSASLAFVYPSLIEGYGFQGLEAMASKILVAASDIGVFREVYKENAVYFDPKSVDSICSSLEKVVNMDEQKKDEMIKRSYKYATGFTWKKTASKTQYLYNEFSKK